MRKPNSPSTRHDTSANKHCRNNKKGEVCIGDQALDTKNEWKKDEKNYMLIKTMKITYKLMTEEIQFLRLLKAIDR